MKTWQQMLAHEKVCRDALVACGNQAPEEPDPPGGFFAVNARMFNEEIYFTYLNEHNHTHTEFDKCVCSKI